MQYFKFNEIKYPRNVKRPAFTAGLSMFTSLDVKRLRGRVIGTRRYTIEPGGRFTAR